MKTRIRTKTVIIILLILTAAPALNWADGKVCETFLWQLLSQIPQTNGKNSIDWLGMDLETVYKKFGVPQEVFCYRADKKEDDNVVFYYKDHIYLFWFENRVWVVRFDERFKHEFLGIKMGMPREQILEILGDKFKETEDSLVFYLPDQGFPVRLRLFFKENMLFDAYVYRGDY
ncbi:MAG: hypothetical protein JW822_08585 [Spirochaetales bacterium]|nr:hypothetical protein [Spirochaetales bacterium]